MSEPAKKVSILLADVDGTLVTKDKILTERAIAAIHRLEERGIKFAITSGRPPKGMQMLFDPLDIRTPIAGFNGGLIVNRDLSVVESKNLSRKAAETTVASLRKHGLDVWVYAGEDWIVPDADGPHVAREKWTVKFDPKVSKDIDAALDHAVKIVGVSDDLEGVRAAERDLQQELGDTASAARSQPYYLDVTHPQANKGDVVGAFASLLKIPPEEFATFGDQPNDVLMFRKSGVSIAMGQAADEVKEAATYVTDDSENEGFAKGVERFLLGETGA